MRIIMLKKIKRGERVNVSSNFFGIALNIKFLDTVCNACQKETENIPDKK